MTDSIVVHPKFGDEQIRVSNLSNGNGVAPGTKISQLAEAVAIDLNTKSNCVAILVDGTDANPNDILGENFTDEGRYYYRLNMDRKNLTPFQVPSTKGPQALFACSVPKCTARYEMQPNGWARHICGHFTCSTCTGNAGERVHQESLDERCIVCPICFVYTNKTTLAVDGELTYAVETNGNTTLDRILNETRCKLGQNCNNQATIRERFGIPSCAAHFEAHQNDQRNGGRVVNPSVPMVPCDSLQIHSDCGNNTITSYCNDCTSGVCPMCRENHEGHAVVRLNDIRDKTSIAAQRWSSLTQRLLNIEHSTDNAVRFREDVIENHGKGVEQLQDFLDKRLETIKNTFETQRVELRRMQQELDSAEQQLVAQSKKEVQLLIEQYNRSKAGAVTAIDRHLGELSAQQLEVLDQHVALTQIIAAAPTLLSLPDVTSFVNSWESSNNIQPLSVSTFKPTDVELPPMIHFVPSEVRGDGRYAKMKLEFSPTLPPITNPEATQHRLPGMQCTRGTWGSLTPYELTVAMLHCLTGRFVNSEVDIQDLLTVAGDVTDRQQLFRKVTDWIEASEEYTVTSSAQTCVAFGGTAQDEELLKFEILPRFLKES